MGSKNLTHLGSNCYSPFIKNAYGVLIAMSNLSQDVGFWNLKIHVHLFLGLTQSSWMVYFPCLHSL